MRIPLAPLLGLALLAAGPLPASPCGHSPPPHSPPPSRPPQTHGPNVPQVPNGPADPAGLAHRQNLEQGTEAANADAVTDAQDEIGDLEDHRAELEEELAEIHELQEWIAEDPGARHDIGRDHFGGLPADQVDGELAAFADDLEDQLAQNQADLDAERAHLADLQGTPAPGGATETAGSTTGPHPVPGGLPRLPRDPRTGALTVDGALGQDPPAIPGPPVSSGPRTIEQVIHDEAVKTGDAITDIGGWIVDGPDQDAGRGPVVDPEAVKAIEAQRAAEAQAELDKQQAEADAIRQRQLELEESGDAPWQQPRQIGLPRDADGNPAVDRPLGGRPVPGGR